MDGVSSARARHTYGVNDGRRVLVVDDDNAVRDVLALTLEDELGVTVDTASNGVDALARIALARPGLVLLDLAMPGIDGFELCTLLHADPAYADVPVVAVSALGPRDEVRRSALAVGCSDFLAKPFDIAAIVGVVERYCRTG